MKQANKEQIEQKARDKAANDTNLDQRKAVLRQLSDMGIQVPAASAWKLKQLHMLYDVVAPIVRQKDSMARDLEALRALEVANWSKQDPPGRWPEEGMTVADQAAIAARLLKLAELTGRPMVELLEQCRDLARQYRLQTWYALAAVEKMNGYEWNKWAGVYLQQLELGL